MIFLSFLFLFAVGANAQSEDEFLYGRFPDDFMWGVATAAYQIEGAWNTSGKGENIWDHMVHTNPSSIKEEANGDIATDSYHLYETDVQIIKDLGLDFYRFSLSWSRLLPTGRTDQINQDGLDYYNNLINLLLENNIQPLITLYHWDLPQDLQEEFEGWLSEDIVEIFANYADFVFSSFGDRVKYWITLNEPWVKSVEGYGVGDMAPQMQGSGSKDYNAAHNLIKSHARAWHIYDDKYRPTQQGKVGITMDSGWLEPVNNSTENIDAAERGMQFKLGWFAHPIFSNTGDYPPVMKEYILKHSLEEGLDVSRLPEFGDVWVKYIRGTYDFFGLNHYTTNTAEYHRYTLPPLIPSYVSDGEILPDFDPEWPPSAAWWLKVVPWGFRKLLNWMKNEYGDIPILITENGFADFADTGLNDTDRSNYYTSYINELLKAVVIDKCNVIGYTAWTLMDNFEWADGYSVRFGLYSVDFNDPLRPRTPKQSAAVYKKIVEDNGFPNNAQTIFVSVSVLISAFATIHLLS